MDNSDLDVINYSKLDLSKPQRFATVSIGEEDESSPSRKNSHSYDSYGRKLSTMPDRRPLSMHGLCNQRHLLRARKGQHEPIIIHDLKREGRNDNPL